MTDEREDLLAYTEYRWDCPACFESNHEESDPQGDDVTCGGCGETWRIVETR